MRAKEFLTEASDKFRLVRVQASLDGIGQNSDGSYYVFRYGDSNRSTMHFCVNGVVASHESGNWDNASIVIIADPSNIKAPIVGRRLEDIWYQVNEQGKLELGQALIMAPAGTKNPNNLKIQTYSGDRNAAVNTYLKSIKITPLNIGRNSVSGMDSSEYEKTSDEINNSYGNTGQSDLSSHMGSVLDELDAVQGRLKYYFDLMPREMWANDNNGGGDYYLPDKIVKYIADIKGEIKTLLSKNPAYEKNNQKYFKDLLTTLDNAYKNIVQIKQNYEKATYCVYDDSGKISPTFSRSTWTEFEKNMEDVIAKYGTVPSFIELLKRKIIGRQWNYLGKPVTTPANKVGATFEDTFDKVNIPDPT